MSTADEQGAGQHPVHGQIGYLQLPSRDLDASAAFYRSVFGWSIDSGSASFEAPGMIGQFTTEREPSVGAGSLVWICVESLETTVSLVAAGGGVVIGPPQDDNGERWLLEVDDPSGNRIGIVVDRVTG